MPQRSWFAPFVVVFWCITSGWLLVAKVLPSLDTGSPPGYQAFYASGSSLLPVAWSVSWNGTPVGWALAESSRTATGGLDVETRLQFERMPVDEILPKWVGPMVERIAPLQKSVSFGAVGRLSIDETGALRDFRSDVAIPGTDQRVVLAGTVQDGAVSITIRAGDLEYETTRNLPSQMMLGDELSPHASLPGLYEGRRWTVPVYSPLRPGHAPLEILHAEVGPEEMLFWENRLVRTHVVSYREDPSSRREPRCRIWVDQAGRVLRQEAAILGAKMAFVRRSDEAAVRLATEVAARLRSGIPNPTAAAPIDAEPTAAGESSP